MKMLFLWRETGGTVLFLCCWVALSLSRSLYPPTLPLGIPFKTEKRKTLLRTCASLGLSIFSAGEICARFEKNIFLLWILLRGMTTLAGLVFCDEISFLAPSAWRTGFWFSLAIFPTLKRLFLQRLAKSSFGRFFLVLGVYRILTKMCASA